MRYDVAYFLFLESGHPLAVRHTELRLRFRTAIAEENLQYFLLHKTGGKVEFVAAAYVDVSSFARPNNFNDYKMRVDCLLVVRCGWTITVAPYHINFDWVGSHERHHDHQIDFTIL